jgi:hypothetical protein
MMLTNTISIKDTPLFIQVDGYNLDLTLANITLIQSSAGVTLQLTGVGSDLNQITDLRTYLQSILPVTTVEF